MLFGSWGSAPEGIRVGYWIEISELLIDTSDEITVIITHQDNALNPLYQITWSLLRQVCQSHIRIQKSPIVLTRCKYREYLLDTTLKTRSTRSCQSHTKISPSLINICILVERSVETLMSHTHMSVLYIWFPKLLSDRICADIDSSCLALDYRHTLIARIWIAQIYNDISWIWLEIDSYWRHLWSLIEGKQNLIARDRSKVLIKHPFYISCLDRKLSHEWWDHSAPCSMRHSWERDFLTKLKELLRGMMTKKNELMSHMDRRASRAWR